MRWRRKFPKPVKVRDGPELRTLAEARAFMLGLPESRTWRNEWQWAAARLLDASKEGSVDEAREAVRNALFLNMMLDFEHEKGPGG